MYNFVSNLSLEAQKILKTEEDTSFKYDQFERFKFINDYGHLNFELIQQYIWKDRKIEKDDFENERENFLFASKKLNRICPLLYKYWHSLTIDEFRRKYNHLILQLHGADDIDRIIKINLENPCNLTSLLVIGIVTSWIDRFILITYYYLNHNYEKEDFQKVYTMKNLLRLPEIVEFFGKEFIYFIRLVMGPLHGMNLRNLYWHGFLSPHDDFAQGLDALIWLIYLYLIEKCGFIGTDRYQKLLTKHTFYQAKYDGYLEKTLSKNPKIEKLENLIFPTEIISTTTATNAAKISATKPSAHSDQLLLINELIENSPQINIAQRSMWLFAFEQVSKKRYFEACSLFLTLLESVLRKLYVHSNNIPSFRLSAEINTMCLSLSIILDKYVIRETSLESSTRNQYDSNFLESGNKTNLDFDVQKYEKPALNMDEKAIENLLFNNLNPSLINALFDLLIWKIPFEGNEKYRLRDIVAHGVAWPTGISESVSGHLMGILVYILQINIKSILSETLRNYVDKCIEFVEKYSPCFHPKVLMKTNFHNLQNRLNEIKSELIENLNPLSFFFLSDPIEKEKSARDKVYEISLGIKYQKYVEISNFIRNFLESSWRKSDLQIVSPLSDGAIAQIDHINLFTNSISEFLSSIYKQFRKMEYKVINREAYKDTRISFSLLYEMLDSIFEFLKLLILLLQDILHRSDISKALDAPRENNKNCSFVYFLRSTLNRISTLFNNGDYKVCEEIIEVFYSYKPKKSSKLLSKGELTRAWGNLRSFLRNVEMDFCEKSKADNELHGIDLLIVNSETLNEDQRKKLGKVQNYECNEILTLLTSKKLQNSCYYPCFEDVDAEANSIFQELSKYSQV